MIKLFFISLVFIVFISGNAWAGFDEGLAAYKQKDFEKALREFAPLAREGDAPAQFYLGLLYGFGEGVKKDLAEAVRLWKLAADQGNVAAQSNLGFMYKYGNGVSQDMVKAYKWSKIASEGGAVYAKENLNLFAESMSEEEIVRAEDLAKAWLDSHPRAASGPAAAGKETP